MTNFVFLVGNMGMDPKVRESDAGTKIATFTFATSRPRYQERKPIKDERGFTVQDTAWHRITCFNALANSVETYCWKGMKLAIRGRLNYSSWTDPDGVTRYGTEIIAETIDFLTRPEKPEDHEDEFKPNAQDNGFNPPYVDDIPF